MILGLFGVGFIGGSLGTDNFIKMTLPQYDLEFNETIGVTNRNIGLLTGYDEVDSIATGKFTWPLACGGKHYFRNRFQNKYCSICL